jgi:hypothetical protein
VIALRQLRNLLAAAVASATVISTFASPSVAAPLPDALPPPLLSQQAYLKASNTDGADGFFVVAVSGNTVAVGAQFEDSSTTGINSVPDEGENNSGAVYVFSLTGGLWVQEAYIKASNTSLSDEFGAAIALDGDTLVVGAAEEDSDAVGIDDDGSNDNRAASGAAYVFTRTNGVWSQQAFLKASNPDVADRFGKSVAVDGDTVVVGAINEDSNETGASGTGDDDSLIDPGAAYVFHRSGTTWSQEAYLKASNTEALDHFGNAVAVDGDTVLVAAKDEDSGATGVGGNQASNASGSSGAVYVFTRSGSAWAQQAYLKASNTFTADLFGHRVAISGDTAAIAALSEDSDADGVDGDQTNNGAFNSGAVYVFNRSGTTWSQQAYIKATNSDASDSFGFSLDIDGNDLIVGAHQEDGNAVGINRNQATNDDTESGAAYVYRRTGSSWEFGDYLKASNAETNDFFGGEVSVDGGLFAAGAQGEASTATGVDGNPDSNGAGFSGAAYLFGSPCATPPFPDVPTSNAFCAEIEWMAGAGISTGFGDGTYKPANAVTRQAMSAFMARFAEADLTPCTTQPFSDVPTTNPFCREIQWMKAEGISTGFGDGTYHPLANVTRQAMAAFMMRLAGSSPGPCSAAPFTDVPQSHPFCTEITWMKENGIATGFGDGTYGPALPVTRQAMSAFIHRLNTTLNHR